MSREYSSIINRLFDVEYISRFLSVGVLGAIFDNIVLFLAVEFVAISPLVGKVLSAESSIVLMFVINEYWTFSGHGGTGYRERGRRLLTSNIVRIGGLTVGLCVLFVLHHYLGMWYLLANVLGIGFGFIVNYFSETILTWRVV